MPPAQADILKTINQHQGTTFVFSTHDQKVMQMANRIVMLSDGQLARAGQ